MRLFFVLPPRALPSIVLWTESDAVLQYWRIWSLRFVRRC